MFLGIDIGASFCKAVVIDRDDTIICAERAPMPLFLPRPSRSTCLCEIEISEILNVVISVLKNISTKHNAEVDGIGVAGQMHGLMLVDGSNEPASNFISWQDRRTLDTIRGEKISYLDYLKSNFPGFRCHTGAGLRPGMMGPVLFWMLKNEYARLEELKASFLSDFIVSYLTGGEIACDESQAAGSGIYSLSGGCWSKEFLEITRISEHTLPCVAAPGTECGRISQHISEITGLRQGVPVYISIGDYQAALYACRIDRNILSINIGTGAQVSLLSDLPVYSDLFETRPFFGRYLKCIPGLPGGRAIKVFENFILKTLDILSVQSCSNVLERLDSLVADRFDDTGPTCFPNFFSEDPSPSESGFFNIRGDNFSIEAFYRSLLEGMVREYYKAFTHLKSGCKDELINNILISGGVARKSRTIRNLINAHFGIVPEASPYEEEAAVGAALIAKKYARE